MLILSVSRRTDIPAFYLEWFFNRLREGYALVRNPMNYHQVSRIQLDRKLIDFIVFWTKDPTELVNCLEQLADYQYYVQVTINPYNNIIEKSTPKKERIVASFKKLSDSIGKERTIWRYDPIILTKDISIEYHFKYFDILASRLQGYTDKCIISFIDLYSKTERNMKGLDCKQISENEMLIIGEKLHRIAERYGIKIESCSERLNLSGIGINSTKCIDDELVSKILGQRLKLVKDKNQRDVCGCVESIDIGAYNTCKHGCLYCYANFSENTILNNIKKHNVKSPMLIGDIENEDKITDRKMESFLKEQFSLFD